MNMDKRTGATIVAVIVVLAVAEWALQTSGRAQGKPTVQAPVYQVDPMWPKPLPNNWVMGSVREPLQVVSHFGNGGRYPGQF